MSTGKASIEPSEGDIISNPGDDQIKAMLRSLGHGQDHFNFSYSAGNLGVTPGGSGIYMFYSDGAGRELEADNISQDDAFAILVEARDGGTDWQARAGFKPVADQSSPVSASSRDADAGQPRGPRSLKDQLLDSVKKGATDELARGVRSGVRGLIRKLF
jgi:hypothetical protein